MYEVGEEDLFLKEVHVDGQPFIRKEQTQVFSLASKQLSDQPI